MPEGYSKLTCEDCGGKLVLLNDWVPECWLSVERASVETLERMSDFLQARDRDKPVILEGDVEIKTIAEHYRRTLRCDSCGALYERIVNA